jgi:hypothetical protein
MTPDGPCLVAVNDTDLVWTAEATVRGLASGAMRTKENIPPPVAARGNALIPLAKHGDADVIVVDTDGVDGSRASRWLVDDVTVRLPAHDPLVDVESDEGCVRVTVHARGLLRDT